MQAVSADDLFREAHAAMESGDPDQARAQFDRELMDDPTPERRDQLRYLALSLTRNSDPKAAGTHVRYFQARSENLIKRGRSETALAILRRVVQLVPYDLRLTWHLGVALFNVGLIEAASVQYERALWLIAISGRNAPVWVSKLTTNIGIILAKQRRFAAAAERFDAAVAIDPSSAIAEQHYGAALFEQHDYAGAAVRHQNAMQKATDDQSRASYQRALGLVRLAQHRVGDALDCFQAASKLGTPSADLYFDWGNALAEQQRYGEALDKFEAATIADPLYWKAYHNIADIAWLQGRYRAGRDRWDEARRVYQKLIDVKRAERDNVFFFWFGTILSEIYGEFDRAREMFEIGRNAGPDPRNALGLANLLIEQRDSGVAAEKANAGADAWGELKRAEYVIKNDEIWKADPSMLRMLAEVQIRMRELDDAGANLQLAAKGDSSSAKIVTDFGLVQMAREDYARARPFFEAAVMRSPRSLAIRTELAQAYLKANVLNSAEKEYKNLLAMTGEHIEAWLGLGDVYTAMADAGDTERYADAVEHYSRGIALATVQSGKRVSDSKLSEAYYALGYAHVKVSETSRDVTGKSEWADALAAFRCCRRLNPDNYKAQRAVEKIEKHGNVLASPRAIDALTSGVIVVLALFVFTVAQIGLLRGTPVIAGTVAPATAAPATAPPHTPSPVPGATIAPGAAAKAAAAEGWGIAKGADAPYVVLSLGSILLAIAGFYLPRVLKLKFGSLELEKSPAEQPSTPTALGIRL